MDCSALLCSIVKDESQLFRTRESEMSRRPLGSLSSIADSPIALQLRGWWLPPCHGRRGEPSLPLSPSFCLLLSTRRHRAPPLGLPGRFN